MSDHSRPTVDQHSAEHPPGTGPSESSSSSSEEGGELSEDAHTPDESQQTPTTVGDWQPEQTAVSVAELSEEQAEESLWLQRSDQWVVAAICLVLLGWSGFRWLELSRWGQQQIEIARQPEQEYGYVLNLNTANWVELALLEGVGEVLGKRIVEDREAQGPFGSVDDLRRVTGIGAKTLEKLRPHLYVEPQP